MTIHSFAESLALSKKHEDAPWWPAIYGRAFPGYLSAVSVKNDGWAQRGGIDRVITLSSGKAVWIDEKVRSKSYGDILLETWSDTLHKKPGWMQKDLACDFIAYAFIPDSRCYLLPFLTLRAAWLKFGREWIASASKNECGFRFVDSKNHGYVTRSIAVPIQKLLSAMSEAQIIDWEKNE